MSLAQLGAGVVVGGDFRILRPLGEGGMGAVYVAEQLSTGKTRALKVMQPTLAAEPKFVEKFAQEARIGARIDSDHVVEVLGAGIDPALGAPWIAMELLHGETLDQLVRRRGALPVDEVASIFRQLCHALGAAHRAGIVHRDLKPENLFLATSRREGAVSVLKILDFGIAKIVADVRGQTTTPLGSPLWMAPEQSDPRGNVGPWTDVWALGLIGFYLLTGRAYWRNARDPQASMMTLMRETLFDPIEPASTRAVGLFAGTLPPGFDGWFARCVARETELRFADATAARAALEAALGVAPMSAPHSGGYGPPGGVGSGPIATPPHLEATVPSADVDAGRSTTARGALAAPAREGGVDDDDDALDGNAPPGVSSGRAPLAAIGLGVVALLAVMGLVVAQRSGDAPPSTGASTATSARDERRESTERGPVAIVPVGTASSATKKAPAIISSKVRVRCESAPAPKDPKALVDVEVLAEPSWGPDEFEKVVRGAFGCKLTATARVVVPEERLDADALAAEAKSRNLPAFVARLSVDDIHASGGGLVVTARMQWLDERRQVQAEVTKTVRFPGTYERGHADEEQLLKQAFAALASGVLVSLGIDESAKPPAPSASATR